MVITEEECCQTPTVLMVGGGGLDDQFLCETCIRHADIKKMLDKRVLTKKYSPTEGPCSARLTRRKKYA